MVPSLENAEAAPIAVTMGDPAGIGPDITLEAWSRVARENGSPFFVLGDPALFRQRASALGNGPFSVVEIARPEEARAAFQASLPVLPLGKRLGAVIAGRPDAANASAVIASIEDGVAFCVNGQASALVTNPIAKYVLMQDGFHHAGHTEFLGELARGHGYPDVYPVMLMASERLMVVPVTVHIPLKDVPRAITPDRVIQVAEVTHRGLSRYFGIEHPRLAVCGLNPHAGEDGQLGREEIDIIAPAIAELKSRGIVASGPRSADTLFHDDARKTYDGVLAMYHDQALIPFKTLSFEDGVNVTLGLPFIRTSPDHGTAFELAGTGRASPVSLIAALRLADRMARSAPRGSL